MHLGMPECHKPFLGLCDLDLWPSFKNYCVQSISPILFDVGIPNSGWRERSGSVVECLTRDRGAAGSSLTGFTALWSLSKTHLCQLSTGSTQEDPSLFNWKIVDGTLRIKSNKRTNKIRGGDSSWDGGVVHTILSHFDLDIDFWPHF